MANTLKVKRSNVDGKIPTTSDLGSGELGVNMADRKIYINNGTYIVKVGSGTLEGLADVNALTPVAGDALVYTGTQWANTDRVNAKTIYETVKNVSGTTLAKGTPVYQVGTSENSVTVGAARADDPAKLAVGVLDETTADQAEGRMLVLGEIKGVDTSTFVTGDKIYLGASGGYTNVPPATAAHQFLGVVFRVDANSGSGYITGTLLPDAVRWTGTALEAWTGTAWTSVSGGGGSGTVTSVGLSMPPIFDVTGSPITSSGSLTAAFTNQTANTVFAAPDGSSGTPTFRALSAADIPVLTLEKLPDAWVKKSVRAATTANISLSSTQTIDGIALAVGDRVLVKNQTTSSANGIYVVATTTWSRAADANTSSELAAASVGVDSGTINGGLTFDCNFKSTDTLGTTSMNWGKVLDTKGAGTDFITPNGSETLSNKTLTSPIINTGTASGLILNDGYREEVFVITGTTPAISPNNGSIQIWSLTASSTPTAGTWVDGQSITLTVIASASYTISWNSMGGIAWKTDGGGPPTLNTSSATVITLWRIGGSIYGARVGNA